VREIERKIRDYLLGNIADAEIEKELLTSDDLFEELLIQEDEIIDEYVRWQSSFITTPERKWNLEFAQMFNRYLAERTAT